MSSDGFFAAVVHRIAYLGEPVSWLLVMIGCAAMATGEYPSAAQSLFLGALGLLYARPMREPFEPNPALQWLQSAIFTALCFLMASLPLTQRFNEAFLITLMIAGAAGLALALCETLARLTGWIHPWCQWRTIARFAAVSVSLIAVTLLPFAGLGGQFLTLCADLLFAATLGGTGLFFVRRAVLLYSRHYGEDPL